MLLLALTAERVRPFDQQLTELLMDGQLSNALRAGLERVDRIERTASNDAERLAAIGQLVGRTMLAAGHTEDAEELFQKLPRVYESISRGSVRWLSALDQAVLSLQLNRLGRAAESYNLVADDEAAPQTLRAEAMAGLAVALYRLGNHRRALRTLREAHRLLHESKAGTVATLVRALIAELGLRFQLESSDGLADRGFGSIDGMEIDLANDDPVADMEQCARELRTRPLVVRWTQALRVALDQGEGSGAGLPELQAHLKWLGESGFTSFEASLRIDAALSYLAGDDLRGATTMLGTLANNEQSAHRHVHSMELLYCASKMHSLCGRPAEALRTYKEYAKELLYRTTRDRAQVQASRFLEKIEISDQKDAAMFRLPLRYRRAYAFIIEHLDDRKLSVRQVAAHVDVTERALQMAFRAHLGVTPAEMIRRHRMERIRQDLCKAPGRASVQKTAERWGLTNRSTLAHNYRECFDETPTATLRGST